MHTPSPTPEELVHQAMLERMIANTAKIMFIDSIVVEKKDFLQYYCLNPETGTISSYQNHYKTNRQPNAYVYINELGNRGYLSQENSDGAISLYSCELVDNKWTRPSPLKGINDQRKYRRMNYPFMMGDGETLYFAAEGSDGIGGYDIYTSTYDRETHRFLQPVNIGMPFNSEANDYMFVIDEYSNIGWFATDRNQSQDSVCIYTFIPNDDHTTYNPEIYPSEQIADFARITSIRKTWDDKQLLSDALARLQMTKDRQHQQNKSHDFVFIINDDVTYYQLSDFKVPENVKRYHQLCSIRAHSEKLAKVLNQVRSYYATTSQDERDELKSEILASEQKQHELNTEIHELEKRIRNEENIFLTKKD